MENEKKDWIDSKARTYFSSFIEQIKRKKKTLLNCEIRQLPKKWGKKISNSMGEKLEKES